MSEKIILETAVLRSVLSRIRVAYNRFSDRSGNTNEATWNAALQALIAADNAIEYELAHRTIVNEE